ncbi:MAG TPA: thiamine phosphate synthase [Nitrospiraceae bacterium]|nr:thiamine phosphate synthase [Nitrospiraceae bacterium]
MRMPLSKLHGLYIILDPHVVRRLSLVEALKEAAAGGATLFQYRDKTSPGRELYREAEQLRQAARDVGATFIVNDRCDVALAVEAEGVHLGQGDLPLALAKAIMGSNKLIGISTHTLDQVRVASVGGADYMGFGPIFPTTSKADHEPVVGVEGLRQARKLTSLPMFAIGGMTVTSVEGLIQAGADGIAVMSAIWTAPDIATAVHGFIEEIAGATRPMNG